jgi:GTP pyrophosphokinase
VSVHRQDCPNTFRVDPERRVAVDWDAASGRTFPVRLLVYGQDRPSLLADIAKVIAAVQVNIRTAGIASEDRTVRGAFVVEVPNVAKLNEVMAAIRRLPGVTRVERRQRLMRGAPPRRAAGEGA